MSPSRSTRLEPLQMVAEQREEEAVRAMAECRRRVEEHETRLSELQRYLQEYTEQASKFSTPALMSNRQAFVAKLREAEKFQQQLLQQAKDFGEAERMRWLLKRRDVGVLEQLAASYRLQERRQDAHREQKNLDELAGQIRMRGNSDHSQSITPGTR